MSKYTIFSGTANRLLSIDVASYLNIKLYDIDIKLFADGEINIKILKSVRGKDIFLIQSTSYPVNNNLMELLITIDALKRSSVKSITAIIPYYGYARQDRQPATRTPISARLVANLLETAGANRIVTIDLHSAQIQGFFNIPVDNLYGSILFLNYIKSKNYKNITIASPDIGGVSRARYFAKQLGADMIILDKWREKENKLEVMNIIGNPEGKNIVMIDDLIDTAGTIIKAAKALRDSGAISIIACCTHPVLSNPAYERLQSEHIDELVVLDTILLKKKSDKIKVLSTAKLLGEVIKRISNNESLDFGKF